MSVDLPQSAGSGEWAGCESLMLESGDGVSAAAGFVKCVQSGGCGLWLPCVVFRRYLAVSLKIL